MLGFPKIEWRVNVWVILLALFAAAQWVGGESQSAKALAQRVLKVEQNQVATETKLDTIRAELVMVRLAMERIAATQEVQRAKQ